MNNIENFIDSVHQMHLDNAQKLYLAMPFSRQGTQQTVSPLTNFVFEFFLYNSLYSVDWDASDSKGQLVYHERMKEKEKQHSLEMFCQAKCEKEDNSNHLADAFEPLAGIDLRSGRWSQVSPDGSIESADGERFFADVEALGRHAWKGNMLPSGDVFDLISSCRYFVYRVRNNIFHGSKSLGQTYAPDQARRIEVYDLFLRCLNSLFFLVTGREQHGAALCQLPIVQHHGDRQIELPLRQVFQFLRSRLLKPEDSRLHWKLFRTVGDAPSLSSAGKRALFYPSAGKDFLFPLLVGLPFCTDFFFYERGNRAVRRTRMQETFGALSLRPESRPLDDPDTECHEFEFDSVTRRAWIMRKDNMTFLDEDVPLAFFFHRGDSPGEGGSGQRWDSDLLPTLLAKASPESGLRILTDGEPGGVAEDVKQKLQQISLPNSRRGRDYFYGVIR